MIAFTQGNYGRAAAEFETALKLSPSLWSAKAFLGMCRLRQGETSEGQRLLESSISHIEDRILRNQAGLELINSYTETGTGYKAAALFNQLEARDPTNIELLYSSYRIYSRLAAQSLHKLSTVGKDSARLHEILAQSLVVQERYPEAIEEYRKAEERDPHLAGLHLEIGQAILAQGHTEATAQEAAKQFMTELDEGPDKAQAAFELGRISYEHSDLRDASRWFTKAIEFSPRFAEAHAALGRVFAKDGNSTQAIKELERAVQEAPDDRTVHYDLAQLYKKEMRMADAEREFKIFRELSESDNSPKPSVENNRPNTINADH